MILKKELGINADKTIADELYRIYCYSKTLATLCSVGGSDNAIDPEQLQQIFEDIAEVTDAGAAALNNIRDATLESEANPDPLSPPFIKIHNMMGETERIYVPEYVNTNGLTPTDILSQGVILPEKYKNHKVTDFKLWLHTKDTFKEVYFLVPIFEPRSKNESENDYYKRVGIKIIRECIQE